MEKFIPTMNSYIVCYVGNKSRFMPKEPGQVPSNRPNQFYPKKWKKGHK